MHVCSPTGEAFVCGTSFAILPLWNAVFFLLIEATFADVISPAYLVLTISNTTDKLLMVVLMTKYFLKYLIIGVGQG